MDISHLKQKFIDEAENLLVSLDNTLIELEKDSASSALIGEAFRVMHTIKGASGMYGFDKIVEITHELESLYDLVREGRSKVTAELIEISFKASDHIRALLADENCTIKSNIQNHNKLKDKINHLKKTEGLAEPKPEVESSKTTGKENITTWHILFYPNEDIVKRAVNLIYTFHDLLSLGEYRIYNHPFLLDGDQYWSIFLVTDQGYEKIEEALMFILDYCKINRLVDYNLFDPNEFSRWGRTGNSSIIDLVQTENAQSEPQTASLPAQDSNQILSGKQKTSHINVDAGKLDTLMYLVSELVTAKSELLNALSTENITRALDAGEKIEKLSKQFSENALNLRLVSIHEMTERFKRLIRDLAKQLGKSIDFKTIGNDTELDKSIIDHIGEPVMHLIRNCIDHGIELPENRKSSGKPEKGTITFETVKTGNYVYINISDDGNGIDPEHIYNKAIEKGFIAAGTHLSEKEILDLIFLPGFSTAKSLSNVSGRGVGMDVVLKKIQEIRGEISITSKKGQGTTFSIKLQQTVSIIDTLLIHATGVTYAIPLDEIDSCILEPQENLIDRHNHLINFNGTLIPYIFIEEPNSFKSATIDSMCKLIVIKKHDNAFALVADNIIGEYQAVIKPIGSAFKGVKFLSGASLLGDGSIALLIDTDKLWLQTA